MMIFKRFIHDGCLSYMVGCYEKMECLIIDPHLDAGPYTQEAVDMGMDILYAIDTHSHADHKSGAGALRDEVDAKVVMSEHFEAQREASKGKGSDIGIADVIEFNGEIEVDQTAGDGDLIEIGDEKLLAQETPGHTIDSITLLGGGRAFTGDALMIGQVGRPDLPGGNVASLFSTMKNFKNLSGDLLVYPAHDYSGNFNTSMGYEMHNNPFMLATNLGDFKKVVGDRIPPLKDGGGKMQCGVQEQLPAPAGTPGKTSMTDASLMETMCTAMEGMFKKMPKDWNVISSKVLNGAMKSKEKPFLLDVRTVKEFETGYVKGAVNVPVREVPGSTEKLPRDHNVPIVVMCQSGNRSAYATMYLRGVGYNNVKNLDYGLAGWEAENLPIVTPEKEPGKKKESTGKKNEKKDIKK